MFYFFSVATAFFSRRVIFSRRDLRLDVFDSKTVPSHRRLLNPNRNPNRNRNRNPTRYFPYNPSVERYEYEGITDIDAASAVVAAVVIVVVVELIMVSVVGMVVVVVVVAGAGAVVAATSNENR